jgi:hypothetical protein
MSDHPRGLDLAVLSGLDLTVVRALWGRWEAFGRQPPNMRRRPSSGRHRTFKPKPRKPIISIPENVTPSTNLRLEIAARLGFPDGSVSARALRREADAGRLNVYRVAGKDYTTLADISEMKITCRVQAKGRASPCKKQETDNASGSSATDSEPSALDALKANAKLLKESLPPTSPPSTTPERPKAAVIPMPSKSRTP